MRGRRGTTRARPLSSAITIASLRSLTHDTFLTGGKRIKSEVVYFKKEQLFEVCGAKRSVGWASGEVFEVQQVTGERMKKGGVEFEVVWEPWAQGGVSTSWEPLASMTSCAHVLVAWVKKFLNEAKFRYLQGDRKEVRGAWVALKDLRDGDRTLLAKLIAGVAKEVEKCFTAVDAKFVGVLLRDRKLRRNGVGTAWREAFATKGGKWIAREAKRLRTAGAKGEIACTGTVWDIVSDHLLWCTLAHRRGETRAVDHVDIATLRGFVASFGVAPTLGLAWWCPLGHHMKWGAVVMVEENTDDGKVWVMPVWTTKHGPKFVPRYVPSIEVLDIQPIRVAWRSATGKMELSGGAKVQVSPENHKKLKTWVKVDKWQAHAAQGPRYNCLDANEWMHNPRWTRRETELEGRVR